MKKLLIAGCAMAVGLFAQAATSNWSFNAGTSALLNTKGTAYGSAQVYMIAATTISQADLVTAFRGKSFDMGNYVYKGYLQNGGSYESTKSAIIATTDADGKVLAANSIFYQDDAYAVGSGDKYYAAVVSGDAIYVSGSTVTKKAANLPTVTQVTVNLGSSSNNFGDEAYSSAGWYTKESGDTPEPTSGLLLLLGVASLALKRKRA